MSKTFVSKTLISASLALAAPSASALKEYPLADQRRIEAVISNHEINRIAVVHDRIRQVFGAEGAFAHEVDEDGGQLFIKPLKPQQTEPIHITVVTENGLTQDLKLTLADIGSETILLKQTEAVPPASQESKPLVYHESLIDLTQAMARGEEAAGFTRRNDGEDRDYPGGLQAKARVGYKGALWRGAVFDLYNPSDDALDLKEQDFAQSGDLAIALQTRRLKAKGCTRLYVVSQIQGGN